MRKEELGFRRVGVHCQVLLIAVCVLLLLVTPCEGYSPYSEAVQTSNELGTKIYKLLFEENGNVLFSPLGATLALGAVRLQSRGRMARQIDRVTHWTSRTIHRELKTLRTRLTAGRFDDVDLELRNEIFGYEIFGLRYKYRNLIRYYGTRTSIMTSTEILKYITKHGKRDFSKKGIPQTLFVNSIGLNAHWEIPFTVFTQSSFYIPRQDRVPAKVVQANYMGFMPDEHQFKYFDDQETKCQILELNYGRISQQGDMWNPSYIAADMSMMIALPYKDLPLRKLEENLNMDKVGYWLTRMTMTSIDLSIPKFNLSQFIDASQLFSRLGIQGLRRNTAGQRYPWVLRSVWHEASLAASGAGTTEGVPDVLSIVLMSKPKLKFHADRPFVFLVRDKVTNTFLYIGRIVNPIAQD